MKKGGIKDAVSAAGQKKKAAVKTAVKKTENKAAAVKIEAKKNTRKAAAAVKETAEKAGKAVKAKAGAPEIIIQSPMGGNITPAEIVKKLPKGVESVFVRVDQNKLWWIKGEESGSVDIW